MPEPLLTDVFGANATQNGTTITIAKADLTSTGFVAATSNTAESIVVAMLMRFANTLTETQRATDTVARNVTVTYAGQDTINQAGTQYRRDVWSAVAYKTSSIIAVTPGDY